MMNAHRIQQLAKQAGLVQGPWSNANKERIWQENRDFPDALEVFADLVVKECLDLIEARHKLALELNWDTDDSFNDIKEQISTKLKFVE